MKSITAQQDQFKIALAYLAKLQEEKKYVSPQVKRAFLRAHELFNPFNNGDGK